MGGSPSKPSVPETPPEPEVVKRTEAEVVKARSSAKQAAQKRYGIHGTDITKGTLADEDTGAKKKTLGGA